MEQIDFRAWRVVAAVQDSLVLKLEVEAMDGTEILEEGFGKQAGAGKDGEPYSLRFTTEKIEASHNRSRRNGAEDEAGETEEVEAEEGAGWPADEDETVYVRGWEVTAFVDDEGMLNLDIQKGNEADIFELEPIESGVPLSSRVVLRLVAEDVEDLDDEDEDETDEDVEEADEFDEDYDELDKDETDFDDFYDRDEDLY